LDRFVILEASDLERTFLFSYLQVFAPIRSTRLRLCLFTHSSYSTEAHHVGIATTIDSPPPLRELMPIFFWPIARPGNIRKNEDADNRKKQSLAKYPIWVVCVCCQWAVAGQARHDGPGVIPPLEFIGPKNRQIGQNNR